MIQALNSSEETVAPGKVFVMYPKGVTSGGPLALHQLVDEIRRQGGEAFLTPWAGTEQRNRAPQFDAYDAPEAPVEDESQNLVIFPEFSLRDSLNLSNAQTAIWWLSIGNSVPARLPKLISKIIREVIREGPTVAGNTLNLVCKEVLALRRIWSKASPRSIHFCQSSYALRLIGGLLRKPALLLGDYTESGIGAPLWKPDCQIRSTARVSYNPAKVEAWRISRLKRRLPGVEWLPLQRLTSDEIVSTLKTSSLYLDLGYFPGKDRLPRESIMAGTPVVIALRGSGRNKHDFPLPRSAKVRLGFGWLGRTKRALELILSDRDGALRSQENFRQTVLEERDLFSKQVNTLFLQG